MKLTRILLSIIFISGLFCTAMASGGKEVKTIKSNIVSELESASASGINTIMVVTEENAKGVDEAVELAESTAALRDNVMVALVDRNNEENKTITDKYNLTRYPAPFVLILSPAGNVTGGATPGRISAEQLVKYVPSPCYNQALTARNDRKPTMIFVSSASDENTGEWESAMIAAQGQIDPEPAMINVDVADETEASFLSRVGYRGEETPLLIVVNPSGQVTGKFSSVPDAGMVKLAANKVNSKGCASKCASAKSCSGKEKASCGDKK